MKKNITLFGLTILVFISCSKKSNHQPVLAINFLNNLFQEKYDEAWSMYSDIEKKRVTKEQFNSVALNFPYIANKWGTNLVLKEKSTGYDSKLGRTNFYKFVYVDSPTEIYFVIHFYVDEPNKISAFFYHGPQVR